MYVIENDQPSKGLSDLIVSTVLNHVAPQALYQTAEDTIEVKSPVRGYNYVYMYRLSVAGSVPDLGHLRTHNLFKIRDLACH